MDSDDEFFASDAVQQILLDSEKRFGIHPINREREQYGEYHTLYPQLQADPAKFRQYLRMSEKTFDYILTLVRPLLTKEWSNFIKTPILPRERLFLTLRFLATGMSFNAMHFTFRVGVSTAAGIIKETCLALWTTLQPIHMPQPSTETFLQVAEGFWQLWDFPNCVGAIDGKHIRIQCPPQSGSMYFNYKKYFSVVLQAVADANCKFVTIEVGAFGKQSDGGTFNSSALNNLMKAGKLGIPADARFPGSNVSAPFVLVGDEAYPLLPNLLRPFSRRNCDEKSSYFNERLSRARKCVECAFGGINAKWRILWKPIESDIAVAESITKAICVLHNAIIDLEGTAELLEEIEHFETNIRPNVARRSNPVNVSSGRAVRDKFCDFVWNNKL